VALQHATRAWHTTTACNAALQSMCVDGHYSQLITRCQTMATSVTKIGRARTQRMFDKSSQLCLWFTFPHRSVIRGIGPCNNLGIRGRMALPAFSMLELMPFELLLLAAASGSCSWQHWYCPCSGKGDFSKNGAKKVISSSWNWLWWCVSNLCCGSVSPLANCGNW